jgi:hypothetical protein
MEETPHLICAKQERFNNDGDPGGSRTPNPQIRSLMLYPVELRGRAGDKPIVPAFVGIRRQKLGASFPRHPNDKLCGSAALGDNRKRYNSIELKSFRTPEESEVA